MRGALFVVLTVVGGTARADSEVTARLTLMARSLRADYNVKRPGTTAVPLAVFDFACSDALYKQRVGFAVAELFKSKVAGLPEFALLERADLDKILHEQALQQTGAVDENTAVQLGKVVGAKLTISGNVDKLGDTYQVSARLADVATGEVLAVAVQELPAAVFEQEAGRYLDLVPKEEAIGIFIGIGESGGASFKAHTVVAGPATFAADPQGDYLPEFVAVGVRYQPNRWLLIEGMVDPDISVDYRQRLRTTVTPPNPMGGNDPGRDLGGRSLDLTGCWVHPLPWKCRLLAGAGLDILNLDKNMGGGGGNGGGPMGNPTPMLQRPFMFFRPLLTAGMEWRPQPRLGLMVRGTVLPLRATATVRLSDPASPGGNTPFPGNLAEYTLPRATAFASFALYF